MHFIPYSAHIAPQLTELFAGERPVSVRLWAILDGTIQGRILVDEPDAPTIAFVQELAEGTTYLGGAVTSEALANAVALLRQEQEVVLCLWPDDPLDSTFLPAPEYEGIAIDFIHRSAAVSLSQLTSVPFNYRLRRIDLEIVPRLEGFDYYISMFGSAERAVQQTIGFCLLHGETVVSEAVAGPLAQGVAEIGVGTKEQYRRKGLATITSACVIEECEARGYQAFWNAAQQNVPSIALAKRLGFQTEKPFKVLAWSCSR